MKANHFGKLKKSGGILIPATQKDEALFNLFKNSLEEGAVIEFFAEEVDDDGTIAQLRKVHSMIDEIASHTGYTVSEVKLLVKEQAGLCMSREKEGKEYFLCRSFGDCDKLQLSNAIQACIEIGISTGHPLE